MKEYGSCKSNEEIVFNSKLRSVRNPTECAFGCLKARWQVLAKEMDFKLEKMATTMYPCFVCIISGNSIVFTSKKNN